MKNYITKVFIFVFLLLPCLSFGDNIMSQLMSGDAMEIQRAKEYLFSHYSTLSESQQKEYAKGLILMIDSPDTVADTMKDHFHYARGRNAVLMPTDVIRSAAIEIVGQLRITEALPVLAKHLNYMTPVPGGDVYILALGWGPPYVADYPCAYAMTLMGDTAIPYLVKVLKSHPDRSTRFLAGRTILTIKGNLGDMKPIKDVLNQSTDSTEQANLNDFIHKGMVRGWDQDWN